MPLNEQAASLISSGLYLSRILMVWQALRNLKVLVVLNFLFSTENQLKEKCCIFILWRNCLVKASKVAFESL